MVEVGPLRRFCEEDFEASLGSFQQTTGKSKRESSRIALGFTPVIIIPREKVRPDIGVNVELLNMTPNIKVDY